MENSEWESCKETLKELITAVYNYGMYARKVIKPYHELMGDANYELTEEEIQGSHKLQQEIAVAAANYASAVERYNQSLDPKIKISVMLN